MKIKEVCGSCGSASKKLEVTVSKADSEAFVEFTEHLAREKPGSEYFIPPLKGSKNDPLIPSPGQNPCPSCKYGIESIGPVGCGRGKECTALLYYQLHKLDTITSDGEVRKSVAEFTCSVPNATWSSAKSRSRAKSVAVELFLPSPTSSAAEPTSSTPKSAKRKSRRPSSSKKPSKKGKTR